MNPLDIIITLEPIQTKQNPPIMQYFDINSQELSHQLQQMAAASRLPCSPTNSRHSFGLEDSGQYIDDSQPRTRDKYNQYVSEIRSYCKPKYLYHKWKEIAVVVVLLCLLVVIRPSEKVPVRINMLTMEQRQKYMYITSENGSKYKLDYRKPVIIKPQLVEQQPIPLMEIPENIETYLTQFKASSYQFQSKLFLNWLNSSEILFQAQFHAYNKKYNLTQPVQQQPLCIVAPFHNVVTGSETSWKLFLKSINAQNYSAYEVFMMDDVSTDGSTELILAEVAKNYHRLNNRLTIIKNIDHVGALGNRDSVIRNHCAPGTIIVDIDGDDALIGTQVFNVVNRIYSKDKELWFMYMNHLSVMGRIKGGARNVNFEEIMQPGICQAIKAENYAKNSYRTNINEWVTSELRTYLRDLYVKIPLNYVIEQGSRSYYIEASDRFSMYALVELAGKAHTAYIEQYVYFYFEPNFLILEQKGCTLPLLFSSQAQARALTPLKPLNSLEDTAQPTQNYVVPQQVILLYVKRENQYLACIRKQQEKQKNLKKTKGQ